MVVVGVRNRVNLYRAKVCERMSKHYKRLNFETKGGSYCHKCFALLWFYLVSEGAGFNSYGLFRKYIQLLLVLLAKFKVFGDQVSILTG